MPSAPDYVSIQSTTASQYSYRRSTRPRWSTSGYEYINPFMHKLHIDSRLQMVKICVLSVLLLPIRVVGMVISLFSGWIFASIALCRLSSNDLQQKPLSGWRKFFQKLTGITLRLGYAAASFHYISFKGKRATAKEAPIIVAAPHSSYVDSILIVATGYTSPVSKQDVSSLPIVGKLIDLSQPIYVDRVDPNSRQNTIRRITERALSTENWPQIVIFVEGTCTNRTTLIEFKPGAFLPGVPVQPVTISFPNKYDTFTWTWEGPALWRMVWYTLAQFYSRCEIEFLPVYTPSEQEKHNAKLFARNVRYVMARALHVTTSEYSYEDVIMMHRARRMKIPIALDIVEIERTLYNLGFLETHRDTDLVVDFLYDYRQDELSTYAFTEVLELEINNIYVQHLYKLFDQDGIMNLREFLLCSFFCKLVNVEQIVFLRAITCVYSEFSASRISRTEFCAILQHCDKMKPTKCDSLFIAIDQTHKGYISFDEFENHVKQLPQYQFLFTRQEYIRRLYPHPPVKKPHNLPRKK